MKQTSRVFLGLAIVLLLVVVGGILFLYTNLDRLVAGVIESEGSGATQTDVSVGDVSIDLRAGSAGISSLAVANPEGFSDQPAISLQDFAIDLDPMQVTADPLVIESVTVDGARLLIEQDGDRNNLKTILASIQETAPEQAEQKEAPGKKLIINRFELSGASAKLLIPALDQEREVTVPDVVLTDIGRSTNGATAAAVAKQVLEPVIRNALEAAAEGGVRDALEEKLDESKSDIAEGLRDRLKNGVEPQ